MTHEFKYSDERFADLQMLRYRLKGFENLTLKQKIYIYFLAKATLAGRDITTDQFGKYNLKIRKVLEAVYEEYAGSRDSNDFKNLEIYLKRIWFSNGIYHHYGSEKMIPGFSEGFFRKVVSGIDASRLPLSPRQTVQELLDELVPVMFDPNILTKRVNKTDGEDLVLTSACNYYEGVSQKEVEQFYAAQKQPHDNEPVSYGLNTKLVKEDGVIKEIPYTTNCLYQKELKRIVYWLSKAQEFAENEQQKKIISLLIRYYETGNLKLFNEYSIEWLKEQDGQVDFINGFIEVYGDPLGLKGSWEGLVEYKDLEATKRTQLISKNAQWFEDHSPVKQRFKKEKVQGVTAHVICAAMLGGDEYPSSAIGINLPNAEWIRARYGSKSVTIGNLTEAYNHVGRGNGLHEEFVIDDETLGLINRYGDLCDDLHTDLHECLGHGSGRLLPGVDGDALGAYGDTIEEARADLFGLYYIADEKLIELGLMPNADAYKSQYYTYMMNGLLTQMVRIKEGHQIEEAHMRNRALIARWVLAHADGEVVIIEKQGVAGDNAVRHFVQINDYQKLRQLFAKLLAEIQRIKSEGDFEAARAIVERYAIDIDAELHREVLSRYQKLNIAPYKGFINPWMKLQYDDQGNIVDIQLDYTESYAHQMMRYSKTAESDEWKY